MNDIENEIRALRETTAANRLQFLQAEVLTCFTALERGRLELSLNETLEAEKELRIAQRGTEVIEKFLREAEVNAAGTLPDIEQKLAELQESITAFRSELDAYPH